MVALVLITIVVIWIVGFYKAFGIQVEGATKSRPTPCAIGIDIRERSPKKNSAGKRLIALVHGQTAGSSLGILRGEAKNNLLIRSGRELYGAEHVESGATLDPKMCPTVVGNFHDYGNTLNEGALAFSRVGENKTGLISRLLGRISGAVNHGQMWFADFKPWAVRGDELGPPQIDRVFGQFSLSPRDGCQHDGEYGHEHGIDSSDGTIVRLQEVEDAPKVVHRPRSPGIPIGFLIVTLLAPILAWLMILELAVLYQNMVSSPDKANVLPGVF
jgi:hypothetical protein